MSEIQHLLAIDDLGDDFRSILEWAIQYKQDPEPDYDFKPLDELSIGCIYEKPSTRTRVSFEVGMELLDPTLLIEELFYNDRNSEF